jgi:hypothetical protein
MTSSPDILDPEACARKHIMLPIRRLVDAVRNLNNRSEITRGCQPYFTIVTSASV